MRVGLFYLPAVGTQEQIREGCAGLSGNLYDQMLRDVSEQAVLADRLGYEFIAFTEHHLHVEGLEVSNNPVLLDLYIAMQTKRIQVGQLGIVLPAANPIRVAEDIAMLDRMTGGRAIAGFTRGYQQRWVRIMTQHLAGIRAPVADLRDDFDARNRRLFEECYEIIIRAWTEDLLAHSGEFWKIPFPGTEWDIAATREFGAGVSASGELTQVAVVPKPLQRPHPPVYMPYAASAASVEWAAAHGVQAILAPLRSEIELDYISRYADISGLPRGHGIGLRRDVIITETAAEARELFRNGPGFFWREWLSQFGHGAGLRDPSTGAFPDMIDDGYVLAGTAAHVKDRLGELLERTGAQLLVVGMYNGLIPQEICLSTLTQLAEDVIPAVSGAMTPRFHALPNSTEKP